MSARLTYFRLELKRACKRLPHMAAGAIVLMVMLGTIAFTASKMLYGEAAVGRITIGVVLPDQDLLSKKLVSMLGSLDSVKSSCDFQYMDEDQAVKLLKNGKIYGFMSVPKDFVQSIMNGTNMPVTITLAGGRTLESGIFKELTQAGARTLGSAQAGIYAGDQLLETYGLESLTGQLELDLNKLYMEYSLPREDYFGTVRVRATGDVDPLTFYGISGFVLYLLLAAIPVSGYLAPQSRVMSQKLSLMGVGPWTGTAARIVGLAALMAAAALPVLAAAVQMEFTELCWQVFPALALVCLSAASMVLFFYEAAGTLMGGVLLLFLGSVVLLFLSGGFLPLVFLPAAVQALAPCLPTTILLNGVKMLVTGNYAAATWLWLALMTAVCCGLAVGVKRK